MAWLRAQSSVNHIRSLRAQGEAVRDEVLARAMTQLQQGKDPAQALQFLANTLTNKLLHAPSTGLRQAAEQGDVELEETIKRLFKLPG